MNFWETPLGRMMLGLPPEPPVLWTPVYMPLSDLIVSEPDPSAPGGIASQPLNQQDYPTKESAYYLAGLYGATVTEEHLIPEGGPVTTPAAAIQYTLNWTDLSTGAAVPYKIHAGTLAYYYRPAGGDSAPATLANPDIAAIECNAAIAAARMDALRLVR